MGGLWRAREVIGQLLASRGVIRARDLDGTGVSRAWLEWAVDLQYLEKLGRGLYCAHGRRFSRAAVAGVRAPGATLCLLSALHLHGLCAEEPERPWLAIAHSARAPRNLDAHLVRMSGAGLLLDVEASRIDGVPVRVYSVAKTVVDCFRFRHLVGEEVAHRAFDAAVAGGRCTPSQVLQLAKVLRAWGAVAERLMWLPDPPH